mgnify:CR=1 FL=1
MIKIKGKLKIICEHNNKVIEKDVSEILSADSFEMVETSHRNMGIERHYHAIVEKLCENEDIDISVEFNLWEYPEGILNYEDYGENGCTLIEKPSFEIQID